MDHGHSQVFMTHQLLTSKFWLAYISWTREFIPASGTVVKVYQLWIGPEH